MQSRMLAGFICLGVFSLAWAGDVSGRITEENNHWGATGNVSSPVYYYGADVAAEITIDPGTVVYLMETRLDLSPNAINAVGTVDSFIVFEPVDSVPEIGNWLGIDLDSSYTQRATFRFCKFRYTTVSVYDMPATKPVTFDHCIFDKNYTNAISLHSSHVTVTNCSFSGAVPGGNGIRLEGCHDPVTIRNCIVLNVPVALNCISSSAERITYNLAYGEVSTYYGCPSLDSSNKVLDGILWADEDYHLLPQSPGIDAGDPADDYSQEPDCPNGNTAIDLGAFGNTPLATCKQQSSIRPVFLTSTSAGSSLRDGLVEVYDCTGRRVCIVQLSRGTRLKTLLRHHLVLGTYFLKSASFEQPESTHGMPIVIQ